MHFSLTTTTTTLLLALPVALCLPNPNPNPKSTSTPHEWSLSFYDGVNCGKGEKVPDAFGDNKSGKCENLSAQAHLLSAKATGDIGKEGGFEITVFSFPDCKGPKSIFAPANEEPMALQYNGQCVSLIESTKNQKTFLSYIVQDIK